jgi:hypothetical protein
MLFTFLKTVRIRLVVWRAGSGHGDECVGLVTHGCDGPATEGKPPGREALAQWSLVKESGGPALSTLVLPHRHPSS